MSKNQLFFLLIIGLFLTSCAISKKNKITKKKAAETLQILDRTFNQQIEADWFTSKAKISLENGANRIGGSGWITLKKDSALMVSARKFGFEIARIKITPDSVIWINRLESEFYAESLLTGASNIGLPPNFKIIQDLVLGSLPLEIKENPTLSNNSDTLRMVKENNNRVIFSTLNTAEFTVNDLGYLDKKTGFLVHQYFSNYQPFLNSRVFALDRNLYLKAENNTEIKIYMSFQQPVWNKPSDLVLAIPKSYDRADF